MNKQARLTLEHIITTLDGFVSPEHPKGSFKIEVEQFKLEEVVLLKKFLNRVYELLADTEALDKNVGKTLFGEDNLTPSLINKGWKFWRRSPLTKQEKQAITSAYTRLSNAFVTKDKEVRNKLENLPRKDDFSIAVTLAGFLDSLFSDIQQLSAELKAILRNSQVPNKNGNRTDRESCTS